MSIHCKDCLVAVRDTDLYCCMCGKPTYKNTVTEEVADTAKECYQCGKHTLWLAPDSRCGDCTRYTPEEIRGEA